LFEIKSSIIIHLGKNPKNGGNPPKDNNNKKKIILKYLLENIIINV
jgi:hypothetical protein